jgi:RNA polymerase sigma-70 factor (TIGR02960 family)
MSDPPPDAAAFEAAVRPYRSELHAYCYRMLGSLQDAEDAVQDALLGAWRGFAGFEGRSSLRSWLYRISTHACLRLIEQRPPRVLPFEYSPAAEGVELSAMVTDPIWLEPFAHDPEASTELLESVELAFIVALQHLPATQRAALILREVLGFGAAEVAQALDSTVTAINSAVQRARSTLKAQLPVETQQAALHRLGESGRRALVESFVRAWARSDVDGIVQLLARDATFSMPPLPDWFSGRDAIARFFAQRIFEHHWRLVPLRASGQLAFACYQGPERRLGALNVVTLREGAIASMTGFLDPEVHRRFSAFAPMSFPGADALTF